MVSIVIGTTPTIIYKMRKVTTSVLVKADFTVQDRTNTTIISRSIDSATLNATDNTVSWKLTQQETLSLKASQQYTMMANWLTNDGTAGVTETAVVNIEKNHRKEVLA